ncbi:unnamed protein product, partial [marine sediment metagenome]
KSVFANTILGNPKYKVTQGKIFFGGKEITKLLPEKRVKLGLALAWQAPPAIKGVKLSRLFEKISKEKIKDNPPTTSSHSSLRSEWAPEKLGVDSDLLDREVNVDFSGGEKKISELLQILALRPKLVIFDEIDSGLDLKRLEKVSKIIKKELVAKGVSILLITHSGAILRYLEPKMTNVMVDGRVICKEKDYRKVLKTIKKYGYEKCKKCKLLAG